MSPYRLQYRTGKYISSCEGRHQFKQGFFFPREGFVVDIKNCLTDTDMGFTFYVFFTKYKESS